MTRQSSREGLLMADLDRLSLSLWTLSCMNGVTIITVAGSEGPITVSDRDRDVALTAAKARLIAARRASLAPLVDAIAERERAEVA